jgi:hypothetical protein
MTENKTRLSSERTPIPLRTISQALLEECPSHQKVFLTHKLFGRTPNKSGLGMDANGDELMF